MKFVRRLYQTLTFVLKCTELPYLPDVYVGVGNDIRVSRIEQVEYPVWITAAVEAVQA
jgi:hypothetical protein